MKPLIRWAGGKQSIAKQLYQLFPSSIDRYFEPFVGAGSVYFFNGLNEAYLSDVNEELINFYRWIKSKPEKFYIRFKRDVSNFDSISYYNCRTLYNKKMGSNTLAQAVRFLLLNKFSFNGIYRVNTNGKYNVPYGKSNPKLPCRDDIFLASSKLSHAELSTGDYSNILSELKEGDFVYLDPPYPPLNKTSNFRHYTADRFPDSKQEELAAFCNILNKNGVRFLMSNADIDIIRSLYSNFELIGIEKNRSINCKKERIKVKELCIRNYYE